MNTRLFAIQKPRWRTEIANWRFDEEQTVERERIKEQGTEQNNVNY
jgi:hypothetical protein